MDSQIDRIEKYVIKYDRHTYVKIEGKNTIKFVDSFYDATRFDSKIQAIFLSQHFNTIKEYEYIDCKQPLFNCQKVTLIL